MSGYNIRPGEHEPEPGSGVESRSDPICSSLTLLAHSDLGGSVPASIVNMLSTKTPIKHLLKIQEVLLKMRVIR